MTTSCITAVVLARDEVDHILPCLRTLRWTDAQLVVVDAATRANTATLAAEAGARVIVHPFESWAAQRNVALSHVGTPWVLFVDVDERVPLALADEICTAVCAADAAGEPSGFWMPRQNLILGQWVKHAGWYPDHQLRLFRVDRGRYDPDRPVHELVRLNGTDARLRSRLMHHNYVGWRQFWTKQLRYARSEAAQLHAAGRRAKPHNLILQPLREFRRRYLTLRGYRDGQLGLQLSAALAVADLIKYAELLRLGRGAAR